MKNKKDKERQEKSSFEQKKTAKNDRIKNKIFHEEQS